MFRIAKKSAAKFSICNNRIYKLFTNLTDANRTCKYRKQCMHIQIQPSRCDKFMYDRESDFFNTPECSESVDIENDTHAYFIMYIVQHKYRLINKDVINILSETLFYRFVHQFVSKCSFPFVFPFVHWFIHLFAFVINGSMQCNPLSLLGLHI